MPSARTQEAAIPGKPTFTRHNPELGIVRQVVQANVGDPKLLADLVKRNQRASRWLSSSAPERNIT